MQLLRGTGVCSVKEPQATRPKHPGGNSGKKKERPPDRAGKTLTRKHELINYAAERDTQGLRQLVQKAVCEAVMQSHQPCQL